VGVGDAALARLTGEVARWVERSPLGQRLPDCPVVALAVKLVRSDLGLKSVGLLELTALPTIGEER
jgi:hypothetical protein